MTCDLYFSPAGIHSNFALSNHEGETFSVDCLLYFEFKSAGPSKVMLLDIHSYVTQNFIAHFEKEW